MHFGCGGKPVSKNRMNQELSDFAAHLREMISSCPGVAAEVTRLKFQEPETGRSGPDQSEPPHVGCYESEFNALALELFALQFRHNAAYRRLCEARGVTPEVIEHWIQIPAVPTTAFKDLELSCIPSEKRTAIFHSSGTTEQRPSRHFHHTESLAVYEASLWPWFAQNLLRSADGPSARSDETRGRAVRAPFVMVCLTPPPAQAPYSSLVHMFEVMRRKLGAPAAAFVGKLTADGSWIVDFRAAVDALSSSVVRSRSSRGKEVQLESGHEVRASLRWLLPPQWVTKPVILIGTAFSFVHLLDYLTENNLRFRLPHGSRVMETGGYKNRSRTMPKEELHTLITERLGISRENIVCEYGMSELSSQAYALGTLASRRRVSANETMELAGWKPALPGHFQFPPWARVQIISPETEQEVADGETGLIRVYDLANVFSVMAVQTEDLGVRRGDRFELIGRAHMAEPRGCSLMSA